VCGVGGEVVVRGVEGWGWVFWGWQGLALGGWFRSGRWRGVCGG